MTAALSNETAMRFSANLRHRRKAAGLTQKALGLRAAIHPTWISHLESGTAHPSLDTIARLAEALGIDASDLLARDR
jgi:transcriptional regulator with XRE-family HTH domain